MSYLRGRGGAVRTHTARAMSGVTQRGGREGRNPRTGMGGVTSLPPGRRISDIALSGVTSLPPGRRISDIALGAVASGTTLGPRGRGKGPTRLAFGDDIATPTVMDPIAEIQANTRQILVMEKKEAEDRRIGYIIAGASALFAAAKLGILAIPLIRKKT